MPVSALENWPPAVLTFSLLTQRLGRKFGVCWIPGVVVARVTVVRGNLVRLVNALRDCGLAGVDGGVVLGGLVDHAGAGAGLAVGIRGVLELHAGICAGGVAACTVFSGLGVVHGHPLHLLPGELVAGEPLGTKFANIAASFGSSLYTFLPWRA